MNTARIDPDQYLLKQPNVRALHRRRRPPTGTLVTFEGLPITAEETACSN
jgi:hypothetical protein